MSDDEVLQVDKAIYITLSAVKKALRSDVTDRITFLENKKDKDNVFMGYCTNFQKLTKSIKLTIQEVSFDGKTGSTFCLAIDENHWTSTIGTDYKTKNQLMHAKQRGKILVIFTNIPYETNAGQFNCCLTLGKNSGLWIKLFTYFSSIREAGGIHYSYGTIADGAKQSTNQFHAFAVVKEILKNPLEGNCCIHGTYVFDDPSLENGISVKIFTDPGAFPTIVVGDVVRMRSVVWDSRYGIYKISSAANFEVFPLNGKEEPRGSCIILTENDLEKIQALREWSLNKTIPNENIRPILSLEKVDEKIVNFDLPCRLVKFFDGGQAVAMWVEDGTTLNLLTFSDVRSYDPEVPPEVSDDSTCICVHISKKLLALQLKEQMLLYLRNVKLMFQNVKTLDEATPKVNVAVFEVKGAVELLRLNTPHKNLVKRLNKGKIGMVQPSEYLLENSLILPIEVAKENPCNTETSKEQPTIVQTEIPLDANIPALKSFEATHLPSLDLKYCYRKIGGESRIPNTASLLHCSVTMKVDKNIFIRGFLIPSPESSDVNYSEYIYCHIVDRNGIRLGFSHIESGCSPGPIMSILFESAVYAERFEEYRIFVALDRRGYYPMGFGSCLEKEQGITFFFGSSPSDLRFPKNRGFRDGFFRGIIFSV